MPLSLCQPVSNVPARWHLQSDDCGELYLFRHGGWVFAYASPMA